MPWIWSWLMPQTENLMEYFGLVSASCPGSATSWTSWTPPTAASGSAANIPAELIVFRNERRLRPSFCIGATPIAGVSFRTVRSSWTVGACGRFHPTTVYFDVELYANFHHPQCSQCRRSLANPIPEDLFCDGIGL